MKKTKEHTKQRRSWARGPYRRKKTVTPAKKTPAAIPAQPADLAGLRPRERLDAIHAHQALLDLRQRQGELVEISEVESGHAEMREVVRSDLLGTLPLRLSGALSHRSLSPGEVREIVVAAVREVLKTWSKAGVPVPKGES